MKVWVLASQMLFLLLLRLLPTMIHPSRSSVLVLFYYLTALGLKQFSGSCMLCQISSQGTVCSN